MRDVLAQPKIDCHCHVLDAFTPRNCVWGSDWPFLRAPARVDYGRLLALFEEMVPAAADRRAILWDTPRRLFGFAALCIAPEDRA